MPATAALLLAASMAAAPAPPAPPAPASGGSLVDVAGLLPDARLDVRYATADNLTGRPLYDEARCLLLPGVAVRLLRAAARLRRAGFRVLLHDCYRPLSVQRALWAAMPKVGFVADPATGSHHNRGAAVDLSLLALDGAPVAMPTAYDAFEPRARAAATAGISPEALRHRRALREAMEAEGFQVNPAEWWHYDAPEWRGAPLLDLPFSSVPPPSAPPAAPR